MLDRLVRASYCRHRTLFTLRQTGNPAPFRPSVRYDGGTLRGIHYESVWAPLADFMLTNLLDFDPCIAHRFALADVRRSPPEPSQIASEEWLADYRLVMKNAFTAVSNGLRTHMAIYTTTVFSVETEEEQEQLAVDCLLDGSLQLSPLFRYCFATRYGLDRIAQLYHDAAALQYILSAKAYDKAWATVLPADFKRTAQTTWQRIARYKEAT